jgi:ABC-type glycerol-3-phosphate transport system substrate-binding protein
VQNWKHKHVKEAILWVKLQAADLNPGIMRVATKDGTLPGLPVDISVPLILYKKSLLDAAGIPYPTESWTWNEMIDMAHKLTIRNEAGIVTQFGFGIGPDIECLEPFIMRNGGRFYLLMAQQLMDLLTAMRPSQLFRRLSRRIGS